MSDTMEKIVSLCKRKGFIFQSSEIYGGLNGCWDYGPLGVELLRNIKEAWWRAMTYRDDIEGIDASILMHPRVWEASGHVEGFNDPMVEDSKTNERFRLDHLLEEAGIDCGDLGFEEMKAKLAELGLKSPKDIELTEPRPANLRVKTPRGPTEGPRATGHGCLEGKGPAMSTRRDGSSRAAAVTPSWPKCPIPRRRKHTTG